jgi:GDPmannose 4,6-dehydratase
MRILVTGCFGQDASYLIEALGGEHEVWGLVHRHGDPRQEWLAHLAPGVQFVEGSLTDSGSLLTAVDEVQPQVIYHLGAISAPAAGWSAPEDMANVTAIGTLRLLRATYVIMGDGCHIVVAGSIATHGPYGAAKTYSSTIARDFKQQGMTVTTLHFGGHHSPRRAPHFFGRKVTQGVARIADTLALGRTPGKLRLGPLNRSQDWMSALDAVAALHGVGVGDALEHHGPGDYVVSTGQPYSSKDWVEQAFAAAGLDWDQWVEYDASFAQPTDVPSLTAEPTLPGWEHTMGLTALIQWMVGADRMTR